MSTNLRRLETVAKALVADGKGILAADETVGTLTKRFEKLKIPSTAESRRDYREMLFTAPGSADFISGVIMYDETIRQRGSSGMSLPDILRRQGIIPGIKVDTGAKPLAGSEGETVTEGLDGLTGSLKRLSRYGCAVRQVASGDPYHRSIAEPRLCQRECACTGTLCRPLPGTGNRSDCRTGSAYGGEPHYRAMQRGNRRVFSMRFSMHYTNRRCRWKACSSNRT